MNEEQLRDWLRRIDERLDLIEVILSEELELLRDLTPHYRPTVAITVTPVK